MTRRYTLIWLTLITLITAPALCLATAENQPEQPQENLLLLHVRESVAEWCDVHSVPEINDAVAALTPTQRRALIEAVIDTVDEPAQRARIIDGADAVLSSPLLGFYLELFATTPIKVHEASGGGFAYGTSHISLGSGLLEGDDLKPVRNTLSHELFHTFNARNRAAGGISGLNEGTAIWIFKTAFPDFTDEENALGLAEPTFGTINFYRDIQIQNYPRCIPLGIPDRDEITEKGLYVYKEILMKRDPSRLPIFDAEVMQNIYDKYYRDLNRNQDFSVWLQEFEVQHEKMVEELTTTGTVVLPEGFTNVINICPTPPAR